MPRFGPKTIRLLLDDLTGVTLHEIALLFEDNGIALGPENPNDMDSSVRRQRARRYLSTLDLGNALDHVKLLGVFTDRMQAIDRAATNWIGSADWRDRWLKGLSSAGFEVDPYTYVVTDPAPPSGKPVSFTPDALAALADASAIHDHLGRLGDTVETDPRLAVSTAKALIESTSKLVLAERGQTYSKSAKVPALVTAAQESLGLSAKAVSAENASLRQVLQSLVTLAQGVTEIRNKVGVDHGAESVPTWVHPRHARLVVGAAQVWCQLMLETLADPTAPWRSALEDG